MPDKPITETNPGGVWSMYEMKLKSGVEENLKEWEKSSQFTESIEQAATNKGVNINAAVTEENIEKLSGDAAIKSITSGDIYVPHLGQETEYYCVPTSIRMLCMYFNDPNPAPLHKRLSTTIWMGYPMMGSHMMTLRNGLKINGIKRQLSGLPHFIILTLLPRLTTEDLFSV